MNPLRHKFVSISNLDIRSTGCRVNSEIADAIWQHRKKVAMSCVSWKEYFIKIGLPKSGIPLTSIRNHKRHGVNILCFECRNNIGTIPGYYIWSNKYTAGRHSFCSVCINKSSIIKPLNSENAIPGDIIDMISSSIFSSYKETIMHLYNEVEKIAQWLVKHNCTGCAECSKRISLMQKYNKDVNDIINTMSNSDTLFNDRKFLKEYMKHDG